MTQESFPYYFFYFGLGNPWNGKDLLCYLCSTLQGALLIKYQSLYPQRGKFNHINKKHIISFLFSIIEKNKCNREERPRWYKFRS